MSEFLAREQRLSAGLELANQANLAFDQGIAGEDNFRLFNEAAAILIGRQAEGSESLFDYSAGKAEIEALPAAYREIVTTRHNEMTATVVQEIHEGKLPRHYQLPKIEFFGEQIKALLPVFESMEAEEWEPEIVFVPKQLLLGQWHDILTGYECSSEDGVSAGLRSDRTVSSLLASSKGYSLWEAAVINASDRPAAATSNAKEAIVRSSPSIDTYLALQWSRLARGEEPVDSETTTFFKESLDGRDGGFLTQGGWSVKYGIIELGAIPYHKRHARIISVVRPTVQSNDVLIA